MVQVVIVETRVLLRRGSARALVTLPRDRARHGVTAVGRATRSAAAGGARRSPQNGQCWPVLRAELYRPARLLVGSARGRGEGGRGRPGQPASEPAPAGTSAPSQPLQCGTSQSLLVDITAVISGPDHSR